MISRPTVLVLGAGASTCYGFPLGRELIFDVVEGLREQAAGLALCLQNLDEGYSFGYLTEFRERLHLSSARSVDEFLESNPRYTEVGMAAIAASLIEHEKEDRLRRTRDIEWYEYLFHQMGTRLEEFPNNNLSIITFNYDRSLEYFFFTTLQHAYGLGRDKAAELLNTVPIVHVYGQLGNPDFSALENHRGYKSDVTPDDIRRCVAEMKLIQEDAEGTNEFGQAHEMIREARTLCFLGFGYHETNLRRLNLDANLGEHCLVLGSACGLGSDEKQRVEGLYNQILQDSPLHIKPAIRLGNRNEDVLTFLREYKALR